MFWAATARVGSCPLVLGTAQGGSLWSWLVFASRSSFTTP